MTSWKFSQSPSVRAAQGWSEAVYCCHEEASEVCHVAYDLTLSVDVHPDSEWMLNVSVTLQRVPPPHWTQDGLVTWEKFSQSLIVRVVSAWTEAVYCCHEEALEGCHVAHGHSLFVDVWHDSEWIQNVSGTLLSAPHLHWTQGVRVTYWEFSQSQHVRAVPAWTEAVYCCPEEALEVCHVAYELTLSVDVQHDSERT